MIAVALAFVVGVAVGVTLATLNRRAVDWRPSEQIDRLHEAMYGRARK